MTGFLWIAFPISSPHPLFPGLRVRINIAANMSTRPQLVFSSAYSCSVLVFFHNNDPIQGRYISLLKALALTTSRPNERPPLSKQMSRNLHLTTGMSPALSYVFRCRENWLFLHGRSHFPRGLCDYAHCNRSGAEIWAPSRRITAKRWTKRRNDRQRCIAAA